MERKGTEIILQALKDENVKHVFGYPGGCVIPLFDEFLNHEEVELIRNRHEQASAHAADGYARVSGRASVVIATSGPGATNTITGIATAMLDSIPMVILTGQVRRDVIGTNAFQEINVLGLSRPVTKHNYLVENVDDLPRILKEAFYIAQSGRPGPVLVDIPVDIQNLTSSVELPKKIEIPGYELPQKIEDQTLHEVWEMIKHASRPIIYAGGGVNLTNAGAELLEFAERTNIPITTTLLGLGAIPEDHDLSLGMLGMHGHYTANMAMNRTDLVITLGARFDDRVTGKVDAFVNQAKIIHVDIDASVIDKIKDANIGLVSDAKEFLIGMNKIVGKLDTKLWLDELKQMKLDYPLNNYSKADMPEGSLRPEYVIHQLSELSKGDAVVVTDVGQHQMFTALHYQFKNPRSFLSSGGLGTMGFGFPAAIGAAFYDTSKPIIAISGDGGFQMNIQELATVKAYNLPIIIVVLNNSNLGMVKQWQDFFWDSRYAGTIFDESPDFVKIAEAYGIEAHRASKKEEIAPMIQKALDKKGPILLEFMIDKDAHVYPMIPPNAKVENIMVGD